MSRAVKRRPLRRSVTWENFIVVKYAGASTSGFIPRMAQEYLGHPSDWSRAGRDRRIRSDIPLDASDIEMDGVHAMLVTSD